MKVQSLVILVLILVSASASASLLDYSLSGNLNLFSCADPNFDPKCGEFSVTFTIDDTQLPTDTGGGWYEYYFYDVTATLADGTVLEDWSPIFTRTNTGIEQLVAFYVYGEFGDPLLQVGWGFPDLTYDITDIEQILNALENGPVTFSVSELTNYTGNCNEFAVGYNGCEGTVGLIEPNTVPLPATVWLFGSGLVGLVGIARRKKTA